MKRRNGPVLLGGGLVVAGSWYYLRNPGRSVSSLLADGVAIMSGTVTLSSAQMTMAGIIEREFASAGLGWLVPAAVANAYQESRMDPMAAGDGGKSIGLFQLHEGGGGKGMSRAEREDPVLNTRRIIEETRARPEMRSPNGRTNAQLASDFARYVERCWECGYGGGSSELARRADALVKIYGRQVADTVQG